VLSKEVLPSGHPIVVGNHAEQAPPYVTGFTLSSQEREIQAALRGGTVSHVFGVETSAQTATPRMNPG